MLARPPYRGRPDSAGARRGPPAEGLLSSCVALDSEGSRVTIGPGTPRTIPVPGLRSGPDPGYRCSKASDFSSNSPLPPPFSWPPGMVQAREATGAEAPQSVAERSDLDQGTGEQGDSKVPGRDTGGVFATGGGDPSGGRGPQEGPHVGVKLGDEHGAGASSGAEGLVGGGGDTGSGGGAAGDDGDAAAAAAHAARHALVASAVEERARMPRFSAGLESGAGTDGANFECELPRGGSAWVRDAGRVSPDALAGVRAARLAADNRERVSSAPNARLSFRLPIARRAVERFLCCADPSSPRVGRTARIFGQVASLRRGCYVVTPYPHL